MGKRLLEFTPISAASTRSKLAFSKPIASVILLGRMFSHLYLRLKLKCTSLRILNPVKLLDAWRDFQEGRTRLILAFRHPYSDEPQIFFHAFNVILAREARLAGKALAKRPHARFIHGYEVALWGDAAIRWVMPRIGAVPIHHTKLDSGSLKTIRSILSDDELPLAIAPEGQVSYRSETVPRLEQGTLQMGFWCVQDLEKAGRSEKVVILPLSIHYEYDPRDSRKFIALLGELERRCGVDPAKAEGLNPRQRLVAIEDRVFELAENYYASSGYKPPEIADQGIPGNKRKNTELRREALMNAALEAAEKTLGFKVPSGALPVRDALIGRVYKIRAECWDRIYPEEKLAEASPLEAALANRRAGEAWYAMRHMEFVDIAFYLDSEYLDGTDGEPSFSRLAESAQNAADLMNRLAGGTIAHRSDSLRKKVTVICGTALDMSSRSGSYRENRKKAVESATADLKRSYENCIKEYLDGKRG